MDRRKIIGGGVASGFLGVTGLHAQVEKTSKAASSNLKASITLNGATYTYPDGPKMPSYYVNFTQDGRVVFHLGALGDLTKPNGQTPPYHLGLHHVKIETGARVLFDADIPAHWWNAQWTYRPAPIVVKRTPAQIVAAKRMFPYGNTGAKVAPQRGRVPYTPMGSSNITTHMATTGERPDIGLITDNSAYYMLGGDPTPMLDWAQAAGSCPMHFRDEATGKPIDLLKYPQANSYSQQFKQGSPWLTRGPLVDIKGTLWPIFGGGWEPQQAHYCEMSYVAHMATGDMGFLEDLQYSANFTVLCDGSLSTKAGAILSGERRGMAWAFRNLFMAHLATQDAEKAGNLPAACHPSSYFKQLLDNALAYWSSPAEVGGPVQKAFHIFFAQAMISPWMQDYLNTSLAFGVLTGHSDWVPFYLFNLGNTIDRTSGKTGFPPGYGTPYRLDLVPDRDLTKPPYTYAEAFKALITHPEVRMPQSQYDALIADPMNGGRLMQGRGYFMTTGAVLVMADHLDKMGAAPVRATYPDFDAALNNAKTLFLASGTVNPRLSVVE